MYHLDGAKRTSFGRRLVKLSMALVLALAVGTPVLTPPRVAQATVPPGPCLLSEDGYRIGLTSGGTTIWYECRCREVSPGSTQITCNWVQVTKNALQANANLLYVTVQLDYGGDDWAMLRAGSQSIGGWEQYSLGSSGDSDGTWSIAL